MITNLLASVVVSLVTNTVERVPQHSVADPCPDHIIGCLIFHSHEENDAEPTKKWIRTTVKELKTVSFDFDGKKREQVVAEKIVSDTEVEFSLLVTKDWIPSVTNNMIGKLLVTNNSFATNRWAIRSFPPLTFPIESVPKTP